MNNFSQRVANLLDKVQSPARYTGNEINVTLKEWKKSDQQIKFALAFPDVYEIGMSYPGLQILYELINRREDSLAARAFAPYPDMKELLEQEDLPLFSLEYWRPLQEFNFIGFSLQYEMSFPTVLQMLRMSDLPLRAAERGEAHPLIIAGGPCVFNPEPLADFLDLVLLGDAEEALPQLLNIYAEERQKGFLKQRFLERAAKLQGIYVPTFFTPHYDDQGLIKEIDGKFAPQVIKSIVKDLNTVDYPLRPLVPSIEVPHERAVIELFRGCLRGCRFCQAGYVYRPVRERDAALLQRHAESIIKNTGYDEVSLMSLSSGDYSLIGELLGNLNCQFTSRRINLSLPSLRVDSYDISLAEEVAKVRRSGLTLAPEAGSQRMRDIINKQVTEEELFTTIATAVRAGYRRVKLYFMIGLPFEEEDDLDGIVEIAQRVVRMGSGGGLQVNISLAGFVPKPHTPFQWFGQNTLEELQQKQQYILNRIKYNKRIKLSYHDAKVSRIEGVLARGDRRLGTALEYLVHKGAYLDSWDEYFDYNLWDEAISESGLDADFYAVRQRGFDEILPWNHLLSGVSKDYLLQEWYAAASEKTTPDCRFASCVDCGICPTLECNVVFSKPMTQGGGAK